MQNECPQDGVQMQVGKSLAIGMVTGLVVGCFLILLCWIIYRCLWLKCRNSRRYTTDKGAASTGNETGITQQASNQSVKKKEHQTEQFTSSKGEGWKERLQRSRRRIQSQNKADQNGSNMCSTYPDDDTAHALPTDDQEADRSSYVKMNNRTSYVEQDAEEPTYENVENIRKKDDYDYVTPYGVKAWFPEESQSEYHYLCMTPNSRQQRTHR